MRKFLETFEPFVSLYNLKRVFPEYQLLFDQIDDLDEEVKKGTSKQVEIEYYDLMETLDGFLLQKETIEKYNEAFPNSPLDLDLLEQEDIFDEDESRSILEDEIKIAMDELDDKIIEAQIQSDKTQVRKRVVEKPTEKVTKDMLDADQQYVGISFIYSDLVKTEFNRAFAILKKGVKFSNLNYASKNFVKFDIGEGAKLIIETPELVSNFDDIFGRREDSLLYLLCRNQKDLQMYFNLVRGFIEHKDTDVNKLDDDFLYNNPVIYGAYNDFLYEDVSLFSQRDKGLVERANYIRTYFNTYVPLEEILTLVYCKQISSRDISFSKEQNKNKIVDDLTNKTFNLEGIGFIPHTIEVLDKLQDKGLIDSNYEPSPFASAILSYNFVGENNALLQNDFRPFSYYIANLKKDLEKAKEVYYSTYNGTSVYHTKKGTMDIDYALALSTEQLKGYSFKKKVEGNSFPQAWQAEQDFNKYVEYKPFCSGGSLMLKERASSGPDVINFQDYKKFDLWFANTQQPFIVWSLNSSHYNFIKQMYSDKKIKVMGPANETPSTDKRSLFFNVVDENNNLLAILRPLGSRNKAQNVNVDSRGQAISKPSDQLDFTFYTMWKKFSSIEIPNPVWDFENVLDTLKKENGDFITKGVYLDDAGESGEYKTTTNFGDDLVEVEDDDEINLSKLDDAVDDNENSEKLRVKYEELEALEEVLMEMGEDEEINEEIRKIKEEITELKK